jgi:hypothetical protein
MQDSLEPKTLLNNEEQVYKNSSISQPSDSEAFPYPQAPSSKKKINELGEKNIYL